MRGDFKWSDDLLDKDKHIDDAQKLLTVAQALLRQFMDVDRGLPAPKFDQQAVRQAVLLVQQHSDYQILGICAATATQAIAALHAYLTAFGYSELPQPAPIKGSVYLKFNPKTGLCYLSPYSGSARGVLISCQSAYDGDVNEVFGHLPLELFD